MNCHFCGGAIANPSAAFRRVLGWERPGRGAGGQSGSSLVLREPTAELACPECVTQKLLGVHPGQGSLV